MVMMEVLSRIRNSLTGIFLCAALVAMLPCSPVAADEVRDPAALMPDRTVFLAQNWNDRERQWFYHTSQGSRLMPYDIFINLEQADSRELLRAPLNMLGFGYLPGKKSSLNPDALPVGFTVNGEYLGMTCAACHTQQMKYGDKFIRIDGGQSMANLPAFLVAIETSLQAALESEEKYARFEMRALGENASENAREGLRKRCKAYFEEISDHNRRNYTPVSYGYSRLDAFGAILNKGLRLTGVEDNFNPPDAPTSYPYLWDTPQHDYVEWNGVQSNSNVGALVRNIAEVIGVFGEVDPAPVKRWLFFDGGYRSSIHARNLRKLERRIATLHSPLWPDFFPKINAGLAENGRALYGQYCRSCHQDIDRTDPDRKIKVRMSTLDVIKTDAGMARNAVFLQGSTGIFEGLPRFYSVGDNMGQEAPALYVANNLMVGVLKNNPLQSLLAIRDAKRMGHPEEIHPPKHVDGEIIERGQEVSERALLAYKARPLNGVWTGAPYLHNGSVPNLYELLLPADQRSKSFYIGSWEFDPIKVGYVDEERPGSFYFDTALKGNNNAGHEYGTGDDNLPVLSEEDRWALVEYMKTL